MTSEENIADKPATKNKKQRVQWITALITFFTILAVIGTIYWILVGRFYESTDDAYVSGNIIQVMPQITGQVTDILADETNLVTKGKPLVILDKADTTISLQKAESELALVVRQVSQLYNNVDQFRANVALQEDNLQKAQDDYQRRQGLAIDKVISREDLDHAKIAVDAAVNSVAAAKKELASAISLAGNTDLYNFNNTSLSTNEIYQKHGENYFRELETNIINDLKGTEKSVIATGGGSLLNPDNIVTLKTLGKLIYLLTHFDLIEIRNRLQPKSAFLNAQFTLTDIYEQRKDIYPKAADIIINAENKSVDIIADEIILFIKA